MRLRLTHVLILMALILAAGVVSVSGLESHVGASSVPGAIIVDVPTLPSGALQEFGRGRGGPAWFTVRASGEPCAPFDRAFARRASRGGTSTLLLSSRPLEGVDELRSAWSVVIAPAERLPAQAPAAAESMASFVAEQRGTRPFLAGLFLGDIAPEDLGPLLDPLLEAAASLPSYRRTSLVLLGAPIPDSDRRVAQRFDVGRWQGHLRPTLGDLLEDIP
jgi:hypothetical protein